MTGEKRAYRAEMDFRELIRKPEKLFGYSYLYFLALMASVGLLYVMNLNTVGRNAAPPPVVADAVPADLPLVSPRVIPPVDVMISGVPSGELVARGGELFKANCASCHGDEGKGDGPSAPLMNPKPRNFHEAEHWTNGRKVSEIYKTLQEGIPRNGMASFSYLPAGDRFALIHYVRSLNPAPPAGAPGELSALDAAYGLSKGMSVPGQIPVRRALEVILREGSADVDAVSKALAETRVSSAPGAVILRRTAADEGKVLTRFLSGGAFPDAGEFVREVTLDPLLAGFRPEVVLLSADEWTAMYVHIKDMRK